MGRALSMPCREATRFCRLSKYLPDVAAVTYAKVDDYLMWLLLPAHKCSLTRGGLVRG